jgi:Xaa-Pro aminopeptidase
MQPIGFNKKRFSEKMKAKGFDFIIASSPENIFYTSGLPTRHSENNPILFSLSNLTPTIVVVRQDGEESVITWMIFDPELTWIKDFRGVMAKDDAEEALVNILQETGIQKPTIAVESIMPIYQYEALKKAFPNAKFETADDIFLECRLVKNPEEIDRIKKSTHIAEKTILAMFHELKEGISDIDMLKIAKNTIVNEGASGWDHITMSLGASDPEAPGTGVKMKKNEMTRFDIGAIYKGYTSDVSRHAVLGKIPSDVEKFIREIVDVQRQCIDAIKPGVPTMNILNIAQEAFEKKGEEVPIFPTCHSLGLRCEEIHLFDPLHSADKMFEPGMVFDLEFWVPYEPYNNRLIGMEDTYLVTKNKCERISTLDQTLLVK